MKKVVIILASTLLVFDLWGQNQENADSVNYEVNVADTNNQAKIDSCIETDPLFNASVASKISIDDTTNWNSKLDSFTEVDPLFKNSVAAEINAIDTTFWNNKQNRLTTGTGIAITDNIIKTKNEFYLGQDTLGGIVFYIYLGNDGKQHGLIVSKKEGTSLKWQNTITKTNANRSWDGVYNTNLITDSPVKEWVNYNFSSEWYLPSIDELNLLWNNRFHVNKALYKTGSALLSNTTGYWSSTEGNKTHALTMSLDFGTAYIGKTNVYSVRAIRAF